MPSILRNQITWQIAKASKRLKRETNAYRAAKNIMQFIELNSTAVWYWATIVITNTHSRAITRNTRSIRTITDSLPPQFPTPCYRYTNPSRSRSPPQRATQTNLARYTAERRGEKNEKKKGERKPVENWLVSVSSFAPELYGVTEHCRGNRRRRRRRERADARDCCEVASERERKESDRKTRRERAELGFAELPFLSDMPRWLAPQSTFPPSIMRLCGACLRLDTNACAPLCGACAQRPGGRGHFAAP